MLWVAWRMMLVYDGGGEFVDQQEASRFMKM